MRWAPWGNAFRGAASIASRPRNIQKSSEIHKWRQRQVVNKSRIKTCRSLEGSKIMQNIRKNPSKNPPGHEKLEIDSCSKNWGGHFNRKWRYHHIHETTVLPTDENESVAFFFQHFPCLKVAKKTKNSTQHPSQSLHLFFPTRLSYQGCCWLLFGSFLHSCSSPKRSCSYLARDFRLTGAAPGSVKYGHLKGVR